MATFVLFSGQLNNKIGSYHCVDDDDNDDDKNPSIWSSSRKYTENTEHAGFTHKAV